MNKKKEAETITIPVMHCFDNNYVIPAAVSMYSMLLHANPIYSYHLYVLHTDITFQNQSKLISIVAKFPNAKLSFIDMNNQFDDLWGTLRHDSHFSKELLYKLTAPSVFPQYDKLIITDVDVVFLSDISKSYFFLDSAKNPECMIAGVKPVCPKGSSLDAFYNEGYPRVFGSDSSKQLKICAGYMVYNLNGMRSASMENKFLDYFEKNASKLIQPEQDALNFCLEENQVAYLPLEYVVCSYMYEMFYDADTLNSDWFYSKDALCKALENPVQLHYATATKPWLDPACTKADIWYKYLAECGMLKDHLQRNFSAAAAPSKPMVYCSNIHPLTNALLDSPKQPLMVSVLCVSYNHEQYIEKTLQSILAQKTDFLFELIISDDASTDKTPSIIQRYAEKYPQKMIVTLRKTNVGIGENYSEALKKVRGKYLAICAGDDYWTDENKLQTQVDFLQAHPDYSICCSDLNISDEAGERRFNVRRYIKKTVGLHPSYSFKELMIGRFIASCTVVMRWKLLENVPDFLSEYSVLDFPLLLIHSAFGKIHVMTDKVFSQYNVHSLGLTKSTSAKQRQQAEHLLLQEVNQFLDYRYNQLIAVYLKEQTQPLFPAIKAQLATFTQNPAASIKGILICFYKSAKNRRLINRF